jgi:hypothetical protein
MSSQNIPLKCRADSPECSRNSGHRDYSRLSCAVEDTQLGPSARVSARMLAASITRLLAALAAACPEPRVGPRQLLCIMGAHPTCVGPIAPRTRMTSALGDASCAGAPRLSRRWSCSPIRARARTDRCDRNTKRLHHAVGGDVTVVRPILPGGPFASREEFQGARGGRRRIFKSPNLERGDASVLLNTVFLDPILLLSQLVRTATSNRGEPTGWLTPLRLPRRCTGRPGPPPSAGRLKEPAFLAILD